MPDAYVALIANVGLLALLTWGYTAFSQSKPRNLRAGETALSVRAGLLFGVCAATLMLIPIRLEDGIFGDARAAPLFLSGFVGGPLAALVCGSIAAVGRLAIGGSGALSGVIYIVAFAGLGLLFRHYHDRCRDGQAGSVAMVVYVLMSSIATAPVLLLLPAEAQMQALLKIWPMMTVANMVGVVVLGTLINIAGLQKLALADLDASRERYRQAETRLRDFTEAASDWLWEMDAGMRFTSLSRRFEELTGFSASDVIGRRRDELYSGGVESPDWKTHLWLLKKHKPFKDFQYDLVIPGKETRTIRTSGTPLFDESGEFLGYRGTATDVTEIRKIRAFIYSAFEHSTEPNMVFSPDGVVALANSSAEQLFGYEPGQMVGRGMEVLFSTASFLDDLAQDAETGAAGSPGRYFKLKAIRKSGEGFPVELGIGRFDFDSQTFCVGAIHDLTEIERARASVEAARREAEKANDAKSHFLATMSHELRTPLNAILGFSEILAGQLLGSGNGAMYREYGEDINKSAALLLELVDNILDLSAIEAGRWELEKEWIDCEGLIADCTKVLSLRAKAGGLTIAEEVSPGAGSLYADRRSARQILLNVLTNAVKFTPSGGQIRVAAMKAGNSLVLEIEDSGIGIPEHKLSEVTAFFSHVGSNPLTREAGWGIGLAITKSLVEMHDGVLAIASEEGKGTTIRVSFPLPEDAAQRAVA